MGHTGRLLVRVVRQRDSQPVGGAGHRVDELAVERHLHSQSFSPALMSAFMT
jgi:hypothetical protein